MKKDSNKSILILIVSIVVIGLVMIGYSGRPKEDSSGGYIERPSFKNESEEIYEEDIEYVEYEVESDDEVESEYEVESDDGVFGEIKRKLEGDVEYKQIPYLDVMKDLEGRVGEIVELEGKVLQVSTYEDHIEVRLATELEDSEYLDNKYSYDDVYLLFIEKSSLEENIIEDEILSIKGIMAGFIEYTAVRGNLIKIPSVVVGSFDTVGYDS